MHILGPDQPLSCSFDHVRIAFFSISHKKVLTFIRYLTFHMCLAEVDWILPSARWVYKELTKNSPFTSHLQSGISSYTPKTGTSTRRWFGTYSCLLLSGKVHLYNCILHSQPTLKLLTMRFLSKANVKTLENNVQNGYDEKHHLSFQNKIRSPLSTPNATPDQNTNSIIRVKFVPLIESPAYKGRRRHNV